ncbi:hypothetical protein D3C75_667790 [compost metagenome]
MIRHEVVITRLQLFPEIDVVRVLVALHVRVCHPERIDTDLYTWLAKYQRAGHKLENLINIGVSHGIAANRHASTVNHQILALITVLAIKLVREANINGFIETAIRF